MRRGGKYEAEASGVIDRWHFEARVERPSMRAEAIDDAAQCDARCRRTEEAVLNIRAA
jgi:hypothetical protein